MPNIYINGTLIPNDASSISGSNPITLSWDGLDSDYYYVQYNTYIDISALDASSRNTSLSFPGNTGASNSLNAYFDRYGDMSGSSSWSGYMQVGSSGSVSITFNSDIQGGKILLNVWVTGELVQQSEISVTTPYTRCGPPGNVRLSSISSQGENVILSWDAGTAGTNNSISGYKIQRSSDGTNWSDLTTTNASTRRVSVAPPSVTYNSYYFRVCTMGSAGSSFYSTYAECNDRLTRVPYLSPPTNFTISQESGSEYINASWTASSASGLSTPVQYAILDNDNYSWWSGTGTSARFLPSASGTYTFTVHAYYGDLVQVSNSVRLTVSWASLSVSLAVSQPNSSRSLSLSWSSAVSHASGQVNYTVSQSSTVIYSGTGTSCTYSPSNYSTYGYTVTATLGSLSSSDTKYFALNGPSLKTKPTLSVSPASGVVANLSWTFGEYWYASGSILQYRVYISFDKNINNAWYAEYIPASGGYQVSVYSPTGTAPSKTFSEILTREVNLGTTVYFVVVPSFDVELYTPVDSDWVAFTVMSDPIITGQPVLSLGAQSGAAVQMTWTAATVEYLDTATIYYQFFVGPSSTYSDSYHVGTTTGLSHTMTEAEIISKCGNGYGASSSGSVCYLFVRAYWQKGSDTGGWSTPTGVAFTYYPTINAPINVSLTPSKGKTTSISWTNSLAGNNSQPQSILRRKSSGSWTNVTTGISSVYSVPESVWKALGKGTYELCIAHEWYGRYANSSSVYFTYAPDHTIDVGNQHCAVYIYQDNEWRLCDPYVYSEGQWRLCSTT